MEAWLIDNHLPLRVLLFEGKRRVYHVITYIIG